MKKLFWPLLLVLLSGRVFAYPNYIGHGYNSCINCHFNPFGGGQLTDYGRSVDATLISSGVLYPKSWDEEKVAYTSGFLFRKPKQNWLRTQINYRGFRIVENPGGSDEESRWITMQQDVRATIKFGENDRFIIAGDYGRIPELEAPPPGHHKNDYRSRNLYGGLRFNKNFGIYAGLMDKVYGLRIVEHIAYSRMTPQITMNDQVIGVAGHYVNESWEGGIHLFRGNDNQDSEYRQNGLSGMFEKTVQKNHRIGASLMSTKSDHLSIHSASVHGRFSMKEGSALLAELGQTERISHDEIPNSTARFGLIQATVRPWRGVYFLTNAEYLRNDIKESPYTVRWGPALQYFPIQRIELRADIYDTRNYQSDNAIKDSWTYLLQAHVWL